MAAHLSALAQGMPAVAAVVDRCFPEDWPAGCDLLREVLGNPFRPVSTDPSWLTSTVVSLAEGIYADRAFDRLPILADALQDAGCDIPRNNHHIPE
jgi:hypothetical protein